MSAIRKLKSGKSPGSDGLSAEHFKNLPDEALLISLALYT